METTIEKPVVTKPAGPVPIMLEITEEDRQQADHYTCSHGCLIHTALHRMGYRDHVVYEDGAVIMGRKYMGNDLGPSELKYNCNTKHKPYYRKSIVGKQIILYPSE